MIPPRVGRLCAALVLLSLGACAALQPVDKTAEYTPPPADAPLWRELATLHEDDWFALLNKGPVAYDWRLRAIDSATDSIDLQTFIWDLDGVGHAVRDHLLQAAVRGVFVRVLVDDSFIFDADQALLDIDDHDNIELRVYNPYRRRSSNVMLRSVLNAGEFHRLDHRMHNKVMVIDDRVAIIGGRNLDAKYFGYHEQYNFRDMELATGGSTVQSLADAFDAYWNNTWSLPIAELVEQRAGHGGIDLEGDSAGILEGAHLEQTAAERRADWRALVGGAHPGKARLLLDNPPRERPEAQGDAPVQVGQALLQAIEAAREEIWLVSAYLIPTEELETALARAVERGVRVRILTNSIGSTNHVTAHSAWRGHVRELVAMGVEVHELRADATDRDLYIVSPVADKSLSLHAKLLVIDDDTVFTGSANLDPRSLQINTEMGLLIESVGFNAELRAALEPDFAPRNAWQLQLDNDGDIVWVAGDEVLQHQPTDSFMLRIEDWFLSLLPLEDEL